MLLIGPDGEDAYFVTTDISSCGLFLHSPGGQLPPVGRLVRLLHHAGGHAPILFRGEVVRRVPSASRMTRVPGLGIQLHEIRTLGGPGGLTDFFRTVTGGTAPDEVVNGLVDSGLEACYFPPQGEASLARSVHSERLAPERTLPGDVAATERLLREHATVSERRRSERFPVREEVSWFLDQRTADDTPRRGGFLPVPHAGHVLSVSRRGLFIQTDHALPGIGARLRLEYPVSDNTTPLTVRIAGRVSRHWDPSTEGLPGFGVRIDEVDERGRTGIFRIHLRTLAV